MLDIAEISQHAVSFPDDIISLDEYGKSSGTMNRTYFFSCSTFRNGIKFSSQLVGKHPHGISHIP